MSILFENRFQKKTIISYKTNKQVFIADDRFYRNQCLNKMDQYFNI